MTSTLQPPFRTGAGRGISSPVLAVHLRGKYPQPDRCLPPAFL